MRPATRLARRLCIEPVAGGPPEEVVPDALVSYNVIAVPTNTVAGAISAVADSGDASYVRGDSAGIVDLTELGFAALQSAGGRDVASYEVDVRCKCNTGTATLDVTSVALSTSPASRSTSVSTTIATYTLGPFTPQGGGTWSAATFNTQTITVVLNQVSSNTHIYKVILRATYA